MYAAHLKVNVSLDDNSSHFGDDNMFFYPGISSGSPRYLNTLSIDNCSIVVKRGETRTFNVSFMEGGGGGIGKVSFSPSTTPLNVTITPSEYIEKHFLEFPSVVSITADPSLVQGYYPIDITINGAISSTIVRCKDRGPGDIYIGPGYLTPIPPINVTVV
jgi:hypothetical protein